MRDLLIIAAAVLLGSFVKGVTGSGLPVVAVPVIALFFDAEQAITIMSIPGVVSNGLLIARHRAELPLTRHLRPMVAAGIVGVVLGTILLTSLSEELTGVVLAGLVLAYVTMRVLNPSFELGAAAERRFAAPAGFLGGVLQGGTGISSPLLAPFLHAFRLPRGAYVVSIAVLFEIYAVIQIMSLAVVGTYTWRLVAIGFAVLVPMWAGVVLGVHHGRRMSPAAFDRWVLLILSATAINLIVEAIR